MDTRTRLATVPSSPGVYIMKDIYGKIIYIGKAKSLKQRLSSYFIPSSKKKSKVRKILKSLEDFEYIITSSEIEALILECNLIEKYRPRFNVKLKDGEGYPYIKIDKEQQFPFMEITNKVKKDNAIYYGPYTKGIKDYVKLFQYLFPIRLCSGVMKFKKRPCCNYYVKKCCSPCSGKINNKEYNQMVENACKFLEGKHSYLIKDIRNKIEKYSEELKFEQAMKLRDQLYAIEKYSEKQRVMFSSIKEEGDFIGIETDNSIACIEIYFVREGKITGHNRFIIDIQEEWSKKEIISGFLKQFYIKRKNVPSKIYIEEDIDEKTLITFLNSKNDKKVKLIIPRKGKKRELIQMAVENAGEHLKSTIVNVTAGNKSK